jgi:transposase
MPKRRVLEGNIKEITRAMRECDNPNEYRRIQCIYLGLLNPEMSAKRIGEITLYSESRVWFIHAIYRNGGLAELSDARGGRFRQYLSIEEETELLEPFEEKSRTGALAVVGEVKKAYEEKVGKEVAESTIYRLLDRHGFRKIVPYKRHMKANAEEQEAFKKTLSP